MVEGGLGRAGTVLQGLGCRLDEVAVYGGIGFAKAFIEGVNDRGSDLGELLHQRTREPLSAAVDGIEA